MRGFTVEDLIECYRQGVFPMSEARKDDEIFLVDPARRGVIPLKGFHVPARLARTVRQDHFDVRVDTAFAEVVAACAEPTPGRVETWISGPIEQLYGALYRRGLCHTIECWKDDVLVGGLYGVSIGGVFFGESMFSRARDASKVALVHLVARLIAGGYRLLDAQFITDHLTQFGAQEISRTEYRRRLKQALAVEGDYFALDRQNGGGSPEGAAGAGAGAGLGAGAAGAGAEGAVAAGAAGAVAGLTAGRAAAGRAGRTGAAVTGKGPTALHAINQAS